VNPNADELMGVKCHQNIEALPEKPDVADIVVPPKITEHVVRSCKKLGIMKVWMQPGSESEEAIRFCKVNGIDVVHGVCVMVERRARQN
jgi:predicted CoA-binding protein